MTNLVNIDLYLELYRSYCDPLDNYLVPAYIMNIILSKLNIEKRVINSVNFDEFSQLLSIETILNFPKDMKLLLQSFIILDKDKDGCISREDIKNTSVEFKWGLNDEDIDSIHNKIDIHKTGCVTFLNYITVTKN